MQEQNLKSALLVMDFQVGIFSLFKETNLLKSSILNAIELAKNANYLIIYVKVKLREGYPDVSPFNKSFSELKISNRVDVTSDESTEICDFIKPRKQDIVIVKKRFSAFAGSDLEIILRANQINHLIITGISTSGVVLSTVREAADKDFKLTVLSDCCQDHDEEVNNILMKKVFPRQAIVMTSEEWVKQLSD
jgi:nicotinamidase-related amidase